jgi:D-amino-acid oxidase
LSSNHRIAVVGGGVIGLTNAIRLREAGHQVEILAREFSPNTTSDVAAAFWCPYRVGEDDRAFDWATGTYEQFARLVQVEEAGIFATRQREIFKSSAPDPWYVEMTHGFNRCSVHDLPSGFVDGYEFDTFIIDTPTYMKYLNARCEKADITMIQTEVPSLESLIGKYDLAINCTGVWAKMFVNDDAVYPIRGQVIVTDRPEAMPDMIHCWDGGEYPTYLVPRKNTCILGGTALVNNWDLQPNPETATGIRKRCEILNPLVPFLETISHKVGLRPGRNQVRLEIEKSIPEFPVIHCYGHGGSGYTLSWGCADAIMRLTRNL